MISFRIPLFDWVSLSHIWNTGGLETLLASAGLFEGAGKPACCIGPVPFVFSTLIPFDLTTDGILSGSFLFPSFGIQLHHRELF
jgi:hypothetical protein